MQEKCTVVSLHISLTEQGILVLNIQVALGENGSLQSSQQRFLWTRHGQAGAVMGPMLTINSTHQNNTQPRYASQIKMKSTVV